MRDVVAIVTDVGLVLQELGRPVYLSLGVDDDLTEALSVLPGAVVTETVYVRPHESHVIRAARVRVGRVQLQAQCNARPATSAEVESAGRWYDHVDQYRAGALGGES
jgi:hypothetical protein